MKRLLSLLLLLTFAGLSAQRTLGILPPEISVYKDQQINIFRMKRDLAKAMNAGQEENLQARYDRLVMEYMNFYFAESDAQIDFVRHIEELPDSIQHQVFRLTRLISGGEMERNYQKKWSRGVVSFGGGGQSNKKWKANNEKTLQPVAEVFAREMNCRYIMMIRVKGQHKKDKKGSPNLFGGMSFESIIIDSQTGETVYYDQFWYGRRQLSKAEQFDDNIKFNPPSEIKPKKVQKGIDRLLTAALNKHKQLARSMARE